MLAPLAPILLLITLSQAALAPAGAGRPPQSPERVRVGLVLIEAAVRDRKDRPIRGLRLADFELRIDGDSVPSGSIPVFEEICQAERIAGGLTGESRGEGAPQSAAAPGGDWDSPASGHIVVFFDFTALSFAARQLALTAARRYFESSMAPHDQARILAHVDGELLPVQGFTSDVSQLHDSVETLAKDPATVDLNLADEDDRLAAVAAHAGGPGCLRTALPFALAEQARARRSLDRLRETAASLRDIKGRKSIVLMSDALRLDPGAQYLDVCGATPFHVGINIREDIEALVIAAEASGVTLYTVHAGGLTDGKEDLIKYEGRVARIMNAALGAALDSAFGMQATLALQSGGRSLRNSNDLAAILGSARQDHSCRYELGYAPGMDVPDGRRHTISLKLSEARRKSLPREIEVRHRPAPALLRRPRALKGAQRSCPAAIPISNTVTER